MSIHREGEGIWKVRWREAGRHRGLRVHGPYELAKKVERKKLSARDENRHLDIKKEINFPMSVLLDRYEQQYARKKRSYSREKSILAGIRKSLGTRFVREVDGVAVEHWYHDLTEVKGSVSRHGGTALYGDTSPAGESLDHLVEGDRD